jgi:hypothetical protein
MWYRKNVGRILFLGGICLALFEAFIWYQKGAWKPYPLSMVLVKIVHSTGDLLQDLFLVKDSSSSSLLYFKISDLPNYVERFFTVMPVSAFSILLGYFLFKWETYMGPGLKSA